MTVKINIIGSGPGGYTAAVRAAQLGAEVTIIEKDNIGGTCLNRGCIPSKVMKTTADLLNAFKRADEFGVQVDGNILLDTQRLMDRKIEVIQNQAKGILTLLGSHNVRIVNGQGFIKGPGIIAVKSDTAVSQDIQWDRLIIATGSRPMPLPLYPFDGKKIISSDQALNLTKIPKKLLIVGGGYIGCEFACIFASLGADVTIVEAMSRLLPLPSVDADCSKTFQREMKKQKIQFMTERTVTQIDTSKEKTSVTIEASPFMDKDQADKVALETIDVDTVLVCIGREPDTEHFGLENTNIETDAHGWIIADEQMQTRDPNIFAIGDILGPSKIMLAHAAIMEGRVAAENAMGFNNKMTYDVVPGTIFTMPEIADVGITEVQAKEQGLDIRADSFLFRAIGKAHVIGEIAGQAKIISDKITGQVLGVHIIGPHATDLIAEGALAVQTGCTVKDLAETIHAHPTLAEVVMETAYRALDM